MLPIISRRLGVLAVIAIMSASTFPVNDVWVVREDGVGPVKIGMNLAQLNMVLHEKFSMPDSKDERGCFYVDPAKQAHIRFMIVRGRLVVWRASM
ncbi:MAG: hypothetical protein ABR861_14535 [Terriglobales bacterium]|jgi:hypothetical protein